MTQILRVLAVVGSHHAGLLLKAPAMVVMHLAASNYTVFSALEQTCSAGEANRDGANQCNPCPLNLIVGCKTSLGGHGPGELKEH